MRHLMTQVKDLRLAEQVGLKARQIALLVEKAVVNLLKVYSKSLSK